MKLYSYFRSSTSYRVRIALNLKGLEYDIVPVNLLEGAQKSDDYAKVNPSMGVPALEFDGKVLTQSQAIIEYLEETHPQPALLPNVAEDRAYVRALADIVACDMHPVNNLRILKYINGPMQQSDDVKMHWMHHWLKAGFDAFEAKLEQHGGASDVCFGDQVSIADICLIPQIYNAQRFDFDMSPYPTIMRINDHCVKLPAFEKAHPDNQPDAK